MNIIKLHHPYNKEQIVPGEIVLALGFFDGVHRGHQAVIKTAKTIAKEKNAPLAVMTFNQHPKIIYQDLNPNEVTYLTLLNRKIELLRSLEVDILYLIDYTLEFGMQSPQEFVDRYIVDFGASTVVAGFDYTYGKKEIANMQTLPTHARGRFEVVEVPELKNNNLKVGTTNIKELLTTNQIEKANEELGYIYETTGTVVHGDKRGRTIGYPTANIKINPQEVLPSVGVYVVAIEVRGQWYQGMASIGYNITFEANRKKTCEVYILDFDQDIYGQFVKVKWYHYLRGELKFDGIEGLIHQLDQDLINTKSFFAEHSLPIGKADLVPIEEVTLTKNQKVETYD